MTVETTEDIVEAIMESLNDVIDPAAHGSLSREVGLQSLSIMTALEGVKLLSRIATALEKTE